MLGYERHIWCAGRFAEMKKFFVSLLLLLSMAVTYALPPLEGLWEQDALFSKDYEIRISEHCIVLFDKTIENSKAQIFEYKGTSEGTIFINNFYVSLASKYEEFNNRYFSYERDGNKLVLKGNSGGEIKLKRCPDTPYMADFWCEDKIGSSRFFLDVSYDKFIYVAKDGSFTNVWEIEDLNATEKWIKLKHKDYISSEVNDVIRNHLMQSDYISYDRKGEKMTLDLSTGKLKLVTDARKTFVKNVAIGAGVTAAVVTAAVVGYNVYNSQQLADNSQKQSYNNGKTSSGTGSKNVAAGNNFVTSAAKFNKNVLESLDKKLPEPSNYYNNRPAYFEGQVLAVWNLAKDPEGNVYCRYCYKRINWIPDTPRNGIWDMGHNPGHEYRKLVEQYRTGQITKRDFWIQYYNPLNYGVECITCNRSHAYEM